MIAVALASLGASVVAVLVSAHAHARITLHQDSHAPAWCGDRGPYSNRTCSRPVDHPGQHRNADGWIWGERDRAA